MKSPKTGRRERARSDVRGRTARGEIMLEQRTRGEPLRECELDGGGDPLRKSGNRRCRPDIGAASGGASQNAAKAVMLDRMSTRSSRTGSIQGTSNAANFAWKSECWGWRGSGEEGLQQKRVERKSAQRSAPCNRTLAETPHPQSPQPVPLSRSHLSKHRNKMVGVRGFEPPAPSSRTIIASLSGAKNQTKSAILISFGADQSRFVPLFLSVPVG